MAKKSKRYSAIMESFDKTQTYDVAEAVKNVKSFANAKFDETVEMHIRLGVDGRHADQQVRGATVLPHEAGKVEYRLDKANIIHVIIGKCSFTEEQLVENANALIQVVAKAKPAAAKGQYFKSVTVTSTMGPGVKISTASLS